MTNVAANSSVTSNIHTSISQADDILPALTSLSFSVSASTTEIDSSQSAPTSTTVANVNRNSVTNDESIISLSDPLNPLLTNNATDTKDNNLDSTENNTELLSVLTNAINSNNVAAVAVAATSPSLTSTQLSLSPYDYATNPDENPIAAMWSNVDDGGSHNILSNGFKGSPNYQNSVSNLLNNANIPGNLQPQNRRAITASHGCFQPGLPPNNCLPPNRGNAIPTQHPQNHLHSMHKNNMHDPQQLPHSNHNFNYQQQNHDLRDQQQYQDPHRHPQKPGGYNSNYPVWSNPSSNVPWSCGGQSPHSQQQQQQQQHGGQMQPWNRGRSVPNLNPISSNLPNRKPTSPNLGMSMSAFVPTQPSCGMTSPLKYRRSTSFPGKSPNLQQGNLDLSGQNNIAHTSLDINALDDAREQFMQYQVNIYF